MDEGLLGLGLPDVPEGVLDSFSSPSMRTMFEPGAAQALADARLADGEGLPLSQVRVNSVQLTLVLQALQLAF